MARALDAPTFIPGLELAERFYHEAVAPLLEAHFRVRHTAALIGAGSEVQQFDDATSTDHNWGPRVLLFLEPDVVAAHGEDIVAYLGQELPRSFAGFSTHFSPPDPTDNGTRRLVEAPAVGPIQHRVEVWSVGDFFKKTLGVWPIDNLTPAMWLAIPCQRLRSVTAGRIFHDDLDLESIRKALSWSEFEPQLPLRLSIRARTLALG